MKLRELLQRTTILAVHADGEMETGGVSCRSHEVKPGDVFVAIPGTRQDGNQFIKEAYEKGAVCAVCESAPPCAIPYVLVPSARRALALISANFFGRSDEDMVLIGVTGTNGKTTVTWLIKDILEQKAGAKVGLIGTVENRIGDQVLSAARTTPPPEELQRLLQQMRRAGCTHVVMEVSSHALAQERTYGLRFDMGVFTNLTQDHLDFHGTMEQYCAAKAKLMRSCDLAVYNGDDPWHKAVLQGSTCRRVSYGLGEHCQILGRDVRCRSDGVDFTAATPWEEAAVTCPIPGRFSVYNALAAVAVCRNLGVPLRECADALAVSRGAKGRMEVVPTPGRDYTVLIDYAHTPDALENVLQTVRDFAPGRVIAVFGCGGDRDRTKRPQMGAIAARLADVAVVTTDNPRTEEPTEIIRQILAGMPRREGVVTVENRVEAIGWALDHAGRGDIVVLCGKGHETEQEIGMQTYPLDEREVVAEYLAACR